jgi:hypothetical protein
MPYESPTQNILVIERPNGLITQPFVNGPSAWSMLRRLIEHLAPVVPSQAVWYVIPCAATEATTQGAGPAAGSDPGPGR